MERHREAPQPSTRETLLTIFPRSFPQRWQDKAHASASPTPAIGYSCEYCSFANTSSQLGAAAIQRFVLALVTSSQPGLVSDRAILTRLYKHVQRGIYRRARRERRTAGSGSAFLELFRGFRAAFASFTDAAGCTSSPAPSNQSSPSGSAGGSGAFAAAAASASLDVRVTRAFLAGEGDLAEGGLGVADS